MKFSKSINVFQQYQRLTIIVVSCAKEMKIENEKENELIKLIALHSMPSVGG